MFNKIIELFNKFQTIIFMVVLGFFIVSLLGNGCQKKDLIKLTEKLTGINLENEILLRENVKGKEEIARLKTDSLYLALKYDSLAQEKENLTRKNKNYRNEIVKLENELKLISEDSAYQWLQFIGYPFGGEYKPFGFNGPQVKAIQADKVESVTKDSLISNLSNELAVTEGMLSVKDSLYENKARESTIYKEANRNYEVISINKDEIIKEKDKQIKKQKTGKVIWRGTAVVGIILAVLIASI